MKRYREIRLNHYVYILRDYHRNGAVASKIGGIYLQAPVASTPKLETECHVRSPPAEATDDSRRLIQARSLRPAIRRGAHEELLSTAFHEADRFPRTQNPGKSVKRSPSSRRCTAGKSEFDLIPVISAPCPAVCWAGITV